MRVQTAHKTYLLGKPDIRSVLEREGVDVLRRGAHYVARCIAHSPDINPSMVIYHDSEKAHCYACGFHGDSIDIVMKLHSLPFRDACRYLGLEQSRIDLARITEDREKRELLAAFRAWEREAINNIAEVLSAFHRLKTTRTDFTEGELFTLAELQGDIDILEYHYEILCGLDDRAKYELFREEMDAG